jgi:hypothetical protein
VNFDARAIRPDYCHDRLNQGKLGSLKLGSKLSCMDTTRGRQKSNPKLIGYVYLETWKLGSMLFCMDTASCVYAYVETPLTPDADGLRVFVGQLKANVMIYKYILYLMST